MSQPATTETLKESPKEASASVIAQHAATLKALPFSDVRDFDDAARGFLGTVENARITSPQGRVVWSLEPYGFLSTEQAPPTVCLLYTSPSPRDRQKSRMPSSA